MLFNIIIQNLKICLCHVAVDSCRFLQDNPHRAFHANHVGVVRVCKLNAYNGKKNRDLESHTTSTSPISWNETFGSATQKLQWNCQGICELFPAHELYIKDKTSETGLRNFKWAKKMTSMNPRCPFLQLWPFANVNLILGHLNKLK